MSERLADLHMHTFFSDGTSSPEEVVAEAMKANLAAIAITDHDVIDAIVPARRAAASLGLEVIAGIELSSEYEGKDIHILGYCVDLDKGPLREKIELFLDGRCDRMKQMIMNLRAVGIDGIDFDEIAQLTQSRAVGRAHLANVMVQKGHVASFREAFEKYLSEGKPGYAPKFKQTPFEVIDLIKQSGGVAVMAHPMLTMKDELIPQFVAAGLGGIEVYYPGCSPTVIGFYEKIARKHNLIATGGSDAHGKAKSYTYVGKATVPYDVVEQLKMKASE